MSERYRISSIFLAIFFIDCINIFMSAIALPDIAQAFEISSSSAAWIANSYILGLSLVIPLSTWIAGFFGARRTISVAMLIFSIAALASGFSQHFITLVFFRFLQGMAGGLCIPIGQALCFSLFPAEQRIKISTLIMAVALIAPAISPSIGGILVDYYSWRWVFWSNIPLSLIAAYMAYRWIHQKIALPNKPDLYGLALISAGLAALLIALSLFALNQHTALAILLLIMSVGIGYAYDQHAKHHHAVILNLKLLAQPRLAYSVMVYYAVPGVFTGINLLNIFYLKQSLHWSATATGSLMMLYAAGALLAMIFTVKCYYRYKTTSLFAAGLILHASGIALLSISHLHPYMMFSIAYLCMGIGGGMCANIAQTTALLDFKNQDLVDASTLWNLNRQITFSLGAAVFTLIFHLLQRHLTTISAYQISFLLAASMGLIPLWLQHRLKESL